VRRAIAQLNEPNPAPQPRWGGRTDIAVGDLDGTGNEIVILGDHPEVVDLHGVTL
jgi:hypothetical protein